MIQSFIQQIFVGPYCVPGTVLGMGKAVLSKTYSVQALKELTLQEEESH